MSTSANAAPTGGDLPWHIVERWQEFNGESRANVLRILAVGVFYLVELAFQRGWTIGALEFPVVELSPSAHRAITVVCAAWALVALGVLMMQRNRLFPAWLKFASTTCDLFLMTLVLMAGLGPRSPMVAGYFVIVVLSGLRFSLPLVQATTVGAAVGYLVVNAHARWFSSAKISIPRYHQIQTLLALLVVGIVVGQIVRQVRRMAIEYRERSVVGSQRETA